MSKTLMRRLAVAAIACGFAACACAQDYPTKSIRMIIPFAPGGGSDVTARIVAAVLTERLGRQVVIDNRAGAGGVIGTEIAANAASDGYTLLVVSLAHAINPALYDLKGRYDPIKSFTPVASMAASPVLLVMHPGVPAKSVADLLALSRKQPGKLQYASAGVGSVTHLAAELFKHSSKVDILHVPFKGAGPAMLDVIAGHVNMMFGGLLATVPQVRAGRLRALGIGSLNRSPVLPDVPTIAEAGVPGYETVNWFGVVAPAGTPAVIVERLHKEIGVVQNLPEIRKQFDSDGATVMQMSPTQFGRYIVADVEKWGRVVRDAGIKAR